MKKGKNEQQPITSVEIAYEQDWVAQFQKVLKNCYANSPYFAYYSDELMGCFESKEVSLFDLNKRLLEWTLRVLGFEWPVGYTSSYSFNSPEDVCDMRNAFTPNKVPDVNYLLDYAHVFDETNTFTGYLSCIDLVFCAGPEAPAVIQKAVENAQQ